MNRLHAIETWEDFDKEITLKKVRFALAVFLFNGLAHFEFAGSIDRWVMLPWTTTTMRIIVCNGLNTFDVLCCALTPSTSFRYPSLAFLRDCLRYLLYLLSLLESHVHFAILRGYP
jgi:hypothetical protein